MNDPERTIIVSALTAFLKTGGEEEQTADSCKTAAPSRRSKLDGDSLVQDLKKIIKTTAVVSPAATGFIIPMNQDEASSLEPLALTEHQVSVPPPISPPPLASAPPPVSSVSPPVSAQPPISVSPPTASPVAAIPVPAPTFMGKFIRAVTALQKHYEESAAPTTANLSEAVQMLQKKISEDPTKEILFDEIKELLLVGAMRKVSWRLYNDIGLRFLEAEKKILGSPTQQRAATKQQAAALFRIGDKQYNRYIHFAELVRDFPKIIDLAGLTFSNTADSSVKIRQYLHSNEAVRKFLLGLEECETGLQGKKTRKRKAGVLDHVEEDAE